MKKAFRENGIEDVPVYNEAEIIAGIEYLKIMPLVLRDH